MPLRFVLFVLLVAACTRKAHAPSTPPVSDEDTLFESLTQLLKEDESGEKDTIFLPYRSQTYQGSSPLTWQLIHTELSLSLDWERQQIPGEAQIFLRPYFAPQKELILDAKAFQIEELRLLRPSLGKIISYTYDTMKLYIELDRYYTAQETIGIYIRYRACPEKIGSGGSTAIGGRKGGYFINPTGSRPCVPRQFWTQGEPEAASAWFPTIDSPNQKSTQKLCITIDDSLVSLSNGLLISQKKLANGQRQDCWELKQPHAPYLFALVVGPFQIIKDTWRGKEVSYYMEPKWAPHAKSIFGKTPQMIEFFSNKLGVDYPWPKYSQVIVRDFVSGAMENTTAVIHGDMLFYDGAQAVTENREEVIAHELFHHWFGNLVTCESWAQLPLNESFADYAEYLWLEHAYGEEVAEEHRRQAFFTYLAQSQTKRVPLIRYDYGDPMNMFDAYSYQKGGLTLHLLRQLTGDSAFFLSLRLYLTANAYGTADIDHLRHAFEKVTGQDWTWFFDQHFHRSDKVRLLVVGEQRGDTAFISIKQRDYDTIHGPYRYFFKVGVLSEAGYEEIPLKFEKDTTLILVRPAIRYADVDPKRLFIGESRRSYPERWWDHIVLEGRYLWQRLEGLSQIQPYLSGDSEKLNLLLTAYRRGGVVWKKEVWDALQLIADSEAVAQVLPLAREAIKANEARVRLAAWAFLANGAQQGLLSLESWKNDLLTALQDTSSDIQSYALWGLFSVDSILALQEARRRLTTESEGLFVTAALLLIQRGDTQAILHLINRYPCLSGLSARFQAIGLLAAAYQRGPIYRPQLFSLIQRIAREENPWYLRLQLVQYLKSRLGRDPQIAQLLRQLKEEETHPQLRPIYQKIL
ncbi:MAG: M1 family metallopeptidase [Bacteroidia bacterium]|nr:M1 family metallopeptidase [Bacteroidia bacterium]MDW8015116.1 M1 family metallopeptidase [Bacteroidia bacterium]